MSLLVVMCEPEVVVVVATTPWRVLSMQGRGHLAKAGDRCGGHTRGAENGVESSIGEKAHTALTANDSPTPCLQHLL